MTSSELEKQRELNEKLENDLLQMEAHNPKPVPVDYLPEDPDALAGLDLGKKTVCVFLAYRIRMLTALMRLRHVPVRVCVNANADDVCERVRMRLVGCDDDESMVKI